MTSVVVHSGSKTRSEVLASDLTAAGLRVLGCVTQCSKLVQEVVRCAPDVLVCDDDLPGDALWRATRALDGMDACPVLVFTRDADAQRMAGALDAGVHAYVVNGYDAQRLRPLIHLAEARFRREQRLRHELESVSTRFEERKLVDRAKGILMRARQISDDDAFGVLRTASMQSNQRLGQVSQHIIHSAGFAEAVNRSGQLRMLSQRMVKLFLLKGAGVDAAACADRLTASVARVDANLALLGKSLSMPTYGDLLEQVCATWGLLKQVLQAPQVDAVSFGRADALAEQLLEDAERLTAQLDNAGPVAPLHVLNVAGRQRMLSQRFAKFALAGALGWSTAASGQEAGLASTRAAFEQAQTHLNAIPLNTADIGTSLEAANRGWYQMLAAAQDALHATPASRGAGLQGLAKASEDLLDVFEQLSGHCERSLQMLLGA